MSRSRRRTSRVVFGVLAAVLVVGLFSWFRNTGSGTPAPAEAATADADAPVAPVVVEQPKPAPKPEPNTAIKPIITTTPPAPGTTPGPATKPAEKSPALTRAPAPLDNRPAPTGPAMSSNAPLADGRQKFQEKKLVEARTILNDALVSGKLSPADAASAKALLGEINQILIFSPARETGDIYVGGYAVQPGDRLSKIAAKYDVSWELLCRINNISDPGKLRAGRTIKVVQGPFHAVVTKSTFTLDLYLGSPGERGSLYVRSFQVGLGKSDSTPTGTWMVSAGGKLKNPKFWGAADLPPMEADDPKNPLGERWIALEGTDGPAVGADGYGIHGTIEPDSIGKQASLGCIRLRNEEVEVVFDLMTEGKSTVIVKP